MTMKSRWYGYAVMQELVTNLVRLFQFFVFFSLFDLTIRVVGLLRDGASHIHPLMRKYYFEVLRSTLHVLECSCFIPKKY